MSRRGTRRSVERVDPISAVQPHDPGARGEVEQEQVFLAASGAHLRGHPFRQAAPGGRANPQPAGQAAIEVEEETVLRVRGQVVGPARPEGVGGERGAALVEVPPIDGQHARGFGAHQPAATPDGVAAAQPQRVARVRKEAVGLPRIQAVDFLREDAQQRPQGPGAQEAQVVLVDDPRPVGRHQGAALAHEAFQALGDPRFEHVQHGRHDQAVAGEVLLRVDHVHRDAHGPERVVVPLQEAS